MKGSKRRDLAVPHAERCADHLPRARFVQRAIYGGPVAPQTKQIELAFPKGLADAPPQRGVGVDARPSPVGSSPCKVSKQRGKHRCSYPSWLATWRNHATTGAGR